MNTATTRDQRKQDLLQFLRSIQKAGMPVETVQEHERLVATGLIDSMALLQIVLYLEQSYGIDFSELGVDPVQLGTIGNILDLIERSVHA
jgi:acyl carrier protein